MSGRGRKGVAFAIAVLVLGACVTEPPRIVRYPEDELPAGFSGYFSADVAGNRELLRNVADALEFAQTAVVDRTNRIAGGIDLLPQGARISAVAYGDFPKGLVEFSLGFSGQLQRRSFTGGSEQAVPVFEPATGGLSLSLPRDDALYLSTDQIDAMLAGVRGGRAGINRDTYSSLISVGSTGGPDAIVVFQDPGAGLLSGLGVGAPTVPLSALSLALRVGDDSLFLDGAFTTRSEREAALFGRIGRLFVIVFVRALGLDPESARGEVAIRVEGTVVRFDNIPMTEEEFITVVRRFAGRE